MKYSVEEYIEYNVDGTPNGRASSEKGDVVELPHGLAQRLLGAGKISHINPADNREKKVVTPSQVKVTKKAGGWVEVTKNGKEIDSGRGKEDYERLKEKYGK